MGLVKRKRQDQFDDVNDSEMQAFAGVCPNSTQLEVKTEVQHQRISTLSSKQKVHP